LRVVESVTGTRALTIRRARPQWLPQKESVEIVDDPHEHSGSTTTPGGADLSVEIRVS
jgi:hypothetical protein